MISETATSYIIPAENEARSMACGKIVVFGCWLLLIFKNPFPKKKKKNFNFMPRQHGFGSEQTRYFPKFIMFNTFTQEISVSKIIRIWKSISRFKSTWGGSEFDILFMTPWILILIITP